MMIITVILMIVITIVAVVFAMANPVMIQISFFGYLVQGPAGLFLLIALGVGVLVGVLLMVPPLVGRSWAVMQHKRKLDALEKGAKKPAQKEKVESEP